MSKAPSTQLFSATVWKIDINPYVKGPDRIVRKLHEEAKKETGPIPVMGKLQGKAFSARVVRFRGMWRLYLKGSAAAFRVGTMTLWQIQFTKGAPAGLPLTREYLYRDGRHEPSESRVEGHGPGGGAAAMRS